MRIRLISSWSAVQLQFTNECSCTCMATPSRQCILQVTIKQLQ